MSPVVDVEVIKIGVARLTPSTTIEFKQLGRTKIQARFQTALTKAGFIKEISTSKPAFVALALTDEPITPVDEPVTPVDVPAATMNVSVQSQANGKRR